MKKNITYFFNSLMILLSLFILSCREDVILPENLDTNVNQPIQSNETNSYSFTLNAQEISIDILNNANFTSNRARVNISINDYSSGHVTVKVLDEQMNDRFSYFGNDNESFFTESLFGFIPGSVSIKAVEFTGNLKVELYRTF